MTYAENSNMHTTAKRNVLILDDDHFCAQVIKTHLEKNRSLSVACAHDVKAALSHLDRYEATIDVIVTDILMPDCDGIEFLQHLRDRGTTAKLFIISSADESVRRWAVSLCRAYGLDLVECLKKPLDAVALESIVWASRVETDYSVASTL